MPSLSDLQREYIENDAVETAEVLMTATDDELEAKLTELGQDDLMLAGIMLVAIDRQWTLEQLYRATTYASLRRLRAIKTAGQMEAPAAA